MTWPSHTTISSLLPKSLPHSSIRSYFLCTDLLSFAWRKCSCPLVVVPLFLVSVLSIRDLKFIHSPYAESILEHLQQARLYTEVNKTLSLPSRSSQSRSVLSKGNNVCHKPNFEFSSRKSKKKKWN